MPSWTPILALPRLAVFEFSSRFFKLLRFPDVTTEPDTEVGGDDEGDPGEPKMYAYEKFTDNLSMLQSYNIEIEQIWNL